MGSLSDYAEDVFLDYIFNDQAYTPATTVYLALLTAPAVDGDTGATMTEVANSGNYVRATWTPGAAATRAISNSGTTTFNQASGAWGTVTDWALMDGNTHGADDILAHGTLTASKAIVAGNTPSFAATEIEVSWVAGEVSNYLANIFLDFMFRNQAYTAPQTFVAAIITNPVTDSMTGSTITEPAGNGYARKEVHENAGSSPYWNLRAGVTPSVVDNQADVDLGPASGGSWGTVIAAAIVDALTVGNLLMYDNTMADQAVDDGDTMRFSAGDLDMQCS